MLPVVGMDDAWQGWGAEHGEIGLIVASGRMVASGPKLALIVACCVATVGLTEATHGPSSGSFAPAHP
ncbi:hypothetical protein [Loktanella sp. SALINAS62]|uniref:hypothetical protein n=1 Tax=Loktanella sp. SALINAS62 TaxID=2706124 RepID=UPI001B8C8DB7|nr:hypothetical protein [Loktanella sp. SALINAS62]